MRKIMPWKPERIKVPLGGLSRISVSITNNAIGRAHSGDRSLFGGPRAEEAQANQGERVKVGSRMLRLTPSFLSSQQSPTCEV
ncbi:hypothetical protein CGCSCA4_v006306 [Colletotrichum siamense]|uniref:Uncharacterized protein n=1 Tax=Colletotrichum siamense TaxID=690259 RepID=A0A9P5BT93_COLSI|nr:hypothetical protein CGCSCA4_v006306 [Colletotrichum siamense]KAF4852122.1 hypothetical protein CGCSCA2_v010547 [Colletotrichum siamense]KAF4871242.1 hypothetical protein CGCSCA1_v009597 [Colletotrichum siamense]